MYHSDHIAMCRSRTAVAPLERLKILMQVQGNAKVYTGVWQVRAVLKAGQGPAALLRMASLASHVTPWPPRELAHG